METEKLKEKRDQMGHLKDEAIVDASKEKPKGRSDSEVDCDEADGHIMDDPATAAVALF